jgi:uncharacterized repeat protein (TIGR02543 family)
LKTVGIQTITATAGSITGTSNPITVGNPDAIKLIIAPKTSTITAGTAQTYTVTASDEYGNTWDVTYSTAFIIQPGAEGSWNNNIYTSAKAGTWTVTASYQAISDTASLTVTHSDDSADLDYITIAPKSSIINVGETQFYSANAFDIFGNSWVITATYSCISPNVIIAGNSARTNIAGSYQIIGTFGGKTDSANLLAVGNLPIVSINVIPNTASVTAGNSQKFTALATDGFVTWEVTDQVVWIISAEAGGSWIQSIGTYTSQITGTWIVTATLGQFSDTAMLEVYPNSDKLGQISIDPKSAVIKIGAPQTFTVTAYDQFGNIVGEVTEYSSFSAPGASVIGNAVTVNNIGTFLVTATYAGLTDTATLTVTGNSATFNAEGLPLGTNWTITFDGKDYYSTNDQITIPNLPIATYSWSTLEIISQGQTRSIANQTNGSILTTQDATQTITYSKEYLVTYTSTGNTIPVTMPAAEWVIANGSAKGVFLSLVQNSQGNTRATYIDDNRTQTITAPTTISATYQTQYYIIISSAQGILSQLSQWVNAGSNLAVSVTIPGGDTGHRYLALGYSVDGNPTISGIAYQFINIQSSHNIQFNWQEQYYLTVNSQYGTTIGSGWYNAGTMATTSVSSSNIAGASGTQYVFTGWSGDAIGSSATSNQIVMNGPKAATANWKTQYYLAINSAFGNPTGQGWYDAGSSATIRVDENIAVGNTKHVFISWTGSYAGTANPATLQMNGPITETVSWQTQYQVTYRVIGNAITVPIPATEWVNSGSQATQIFTSPVTNIANNTKCTFLSDNRPQTISGPTEITATYQTQYLLNLTQKGIESDSTGTILTIANTEFNYTQMPRTIWVNKDAQITFNFTEIVTSTGFGKQYVLTNVDADSPLTISMPTLVEATYETQFTLFTVAASALLILLLLLLLALLLWAKRRKRKKKNPTQETTTP